MSSSITIKSNPFQRSNPFHVQPTYHPPSTTSFSTYQCKPSYRPAYQQQSFTQKQNSFAKKPQSQMWKFREDNCGKSRVFNQQSNVMLQEKHLKNSFQKELVLNSVSRRNKYPNGANGHGVNNNSGQEVERGPMENPFGRKYLISGNTLAESQVYQGFKGGLPATDNLPTYQKYKSQYDVYTPVPQPTNIYSYSNYSPPPIQDNYIPQIITPMGSNPNLQTSLYHKHSQYASKKSIERDSHQRNGSYTNLNPVESRYSLERENKDKYNSIESNKDVYQSYANKDNNGYLGNNNYSKSSIPLAERDRESRIYSRVSVKQENVKFEQSDDEQQRAAGSRKQHRQPTFGSKPDIPSLPGPQQITIKGMKFYRQQLVCY